MSIHDLTAVLKTGQGTFQDDPQSGSILKLLAENGFQEKMESGITKGHTYTIIHNPPSTEFVLVDMWSEGEHQRKAYHAFSIRTPSPGSASGTTFSTIVEKDPESEHPLITLLKEMNDTADVLLNTLKKYA